MGNIEQHVGYIMYQKKDNTAMVTAVSVILVVLVITAVAVVIFCFLRKKQNHKFKKDGLIERSTSRYVAGKLPYYAAIWLFVSC